MRLKEILGTLYELYPNTDVYVSINGGKNVLFEELPFIDVYTSLLNDYNIRLVRCVPSDDPEVFNKIFFEIRRNYC